MEDAQVAAITDAPEVYADGWAERLGTPYAADTHGYGIVAGDAGPVHGVVAVGVDPPTTTPCTSAPSRCCRARPPVG